MNILDGAKWEFESFLQDAKHVVFIYYDRAVSPIFSGHYEASLHVCYERSVKVELGILEITKDSNESFEECQPEQINSSPYGASGDIKNGKNRASVVTRTL